MSYRCMFYPFFKDPELMNGVKMSFGFLLPLPINTSGFDLFDMSYYS